MICKICGTEEFNRGHCTRKVTCQDLKEIYNEGSPNINKANGGGENDG